MYRRHKKEDPHLLFGDGGASMFRNLNKTSLIQESRYFNSTILNPKKCIYILTKFIYLLNQGEKLTTQEATNLFFAITKLFQCKDIRLRRLVYLGIKELSSLAQDVIIVTSSLTKDMTGNEDLYRAAAIRALCSITDSSILQAIERYMKQAIVDKNPAVSSSALVSTVHLSASIPDLSRRWANEAQEAVHSENVMVSYHALAVVASARCSDVLAMVKLVTKFSRSPLRSPYALCLLIRYSAKLAEDDPSNASECFMEFIENCLRHKSEIVVYEAAHAIINLRKSAQDLAQAVSVLQIFCGSSKAILRLAGARTLAKLTVKHPIAVTACTVDLENLISDPDRSIATLAVTTLLATSAESSIDRLMKQISGFISEISDELKIVVVNSIRNLCTKYPKKHQVLVSFLVGMLRNKGGVQFKTAIADAIIAIIEENPEAKESGLAHLCEYIEDCEHSFLAVHILHVLGREGPKVLQPSQYIRFIYNRVILESGPVRAAAVSAVARFGICAELLSSIKVLLSRFQLDEEDEVRDRATFYSSILESNDPQLIDEYITNVPIPKLEDLEQTLRNHITTTQDEPFDINSVPRIDNSKVATETTKAKIVNLNTVPLKELYVERMKVIPNVETFGPLFKSCNAVELTESETEYRARCIKHIFGHHLVLRIEVMNTLKDQLLENVYVRLGSAPGYEYIGETICDKLHYAQLGLLYCVLEFPKIPLDSLGSFGAILEFVVRDCDPTTGLPDSDDGYGESYILEEIEISCADQFKLRPASEEWEASWEEAASAYEASDTFSLSQGDIGDAAVAVCEHLDLPKSAIIGGDTVKEIRGEGLWRERVHVLIKARLAAPQGVVSMQLTVRSPREDIATFMLAAVG